MAAPPVPVLCSASPCRVATHLAPPAFRTIAAARPQALPSLGFCVERGGPSPRARAPFAAKRRGEVAAEAADGTRALLQAALWGAEAAYILWLFLLPYAPGDPVWAISQATISDLIGLSLNFFFVLPLLNSVCVRLLESPVLHPMAEGLFNFVIAWTLLFAPLLFTDYRRDRFKGSLDVLWGFQMFLTNTFLIPYMAIRLNDANADQSPAQRSQLGSVMVNGAPLVGAVGGLVCVLSIAWAFFGRGDADFGGIAERWQYVQSYLFSERLAYAFLWDIFLYSIFQPWLIGDNLRNVKADATEFVNAVRFVPVVGLVVYLLCLEEED
ncbi:hypothetical protein BDA96_06G119600 [Sorghum bicolor]|uniref:Uncharacterized protein n=2 Tax=Sorghum bicolor TaxID=4558 RepID=A0A1Z5REA3_SORBI|nr:uncharacterized protein LOC8073441 isoform X2 [Sorghum bicolor]KAG0526136.1 hypothetical protein BDA96_06G119600 [Sorghum bicolor]OQU81716.1 hypothetical protein SORBI_3006G108200 [Sorghum bicolor]|eukprot:XP_002447971.1 uncharacterized protein LOC8073441 isoform X2 [Sorghum bicolor]